MMSFWKRNEREERDLRRVAERQELENAKKAEADREANRQKRKLNFLISQTELYSHFIGRKIKTDEVERSTDSADVAISDAKVLPGKPDAHTINLLELKAPILKILTLTLKMRLGSDKLQWPMLRALCKKPRTKPEPSMAKKVNYNPSSTRAR